MAVRAERVYDPIRGRPMVGSRGRGRRACAATAPSDPGNTGILAPVSGTRRDLHPVSLRLECNRPIPRSGQELSRVGWRRHSSLEADPRAGDRRSVPTGYMAHSMQMV